jgi:tetratricopeptide (TPR) repeat protein
VLRWQNTETSIRYALSVTANNFVAYGNLGVYYAERREHEWANRCYRAALVIQPGSRYDWNDLAIDLINQGKYQEAVFSCQAALQVDPTWPSPHSTLGQPTTAEIEMLLLDPMAGLLLKLAEKDLEPLRQNNLWVLARLQQQAAAEAARAA